MSDRPKLGKLPFEPDARDFKLKAFSVSLPPAPKIAFGYGNIYADWGMLGNDRYGDCVFAGAAHEHMLYNKLAKHPLSFTVDNVLADYAAVTGFNPADPNTDQGAYPRDAMNYRRTTGLIAADGKRHKIEAFVQIPAQDWDMLIRCIWTFGAVGIGFNFPTSAWDQYDAGKRWDVVDGASIDGGHYVPMVGSVAPATEATCITWGRRQTMSKEFYQKYNDESWVPLTKESLLPPSNVRHIDWDTLSSQLSSL